jgi:hypothetical protein
MLAEAGVHTDNKVPETGTDPLNSPEDWSFAMGSGYRGTLAQIDAETLVHVREKSLSHLDENQVVAIKSNVGHEGSSLRNMTL